MSEEGKKIILEEGRKGAGQSNKMERRVVNNHEFYFSVVDDADGDEASGLQIGMHEQDTVKASNVYEDGGDEDLLLVNVSDVNS